MNKDKYVFATNQFRVLKLFFSVFLTSPAVFYFIATSQTQEKTWNFGELLTPPQSLFAVCAIAAFVAAFIIPDMLLRSQIKATLAKPWNHTAAQEVLRNEDGSPVDVSVLMQLPEQEKRLLKCFPVFVIYYVLRFVFLESVSILGFNVFLQTHNLYHLIPFALATYFGLLLSIPRIQACEEKMQPYI